MAGIVKHSQPLYELTVSDAVITAVGNKCYRCNAIKVIISFYTVERTSNRYFASEGKQKTLSLMIEDLPNQN